MATTQRRAVITGVGVVTPIGSDPAAFWQALAAGEGGIRPVTSLDASELPIRIGGEIPAFDAKKFIPPAEKDARKALRMMAKMVQLGLAAARAAFDDSKLAKGQLDPTRFGVEFGSGMVATELDELGPASRISTNCAPGAVSYALWGEKGLGEIQPTWMLRYLPNMPACHVSIQLDAQGPNNTITESEVASVLAVGEAFRVMGRGLADYILVGGTESKINPLSLARHTLFQELSKRNDAPNRALRPFDADRDGTVLGEGAAVFGLEDLEHAKKRNARIYAEVCGFAAGFDRARDGKVLAKVIRKAMREAGVTPEQVDHVNAHGAGTVRGDVMEAAAVREVFGDRGVPVFAPKSNVGNLGSGAGAVELAASVLALHHGQLPGTRNHDRPDPACPVAVHTGAPRPVAKPYAVKIGYTDMGQCGAVVIRKWQE